MLLAIDTATRHASIALYGDDGPVVEHSWLSRNRHSVELAPAIAAMLVQQRIPSTELTGVAVASGPGSFTGLRIGMSVAKGFALGLNIPIVGIATLDVVAYATGDVGLPVIAALETGRGRLCVATYAFRDGLPTVQRPPEIVRSAEWAPPTEVPLVVTGELDAALVERLLTLPGSERITLLTPAGSLRRAGYLAEMAQERFEQGTVDDLDSLSPTYAQYPTSGSGA